MKLIFSAAFVVMTRAALNIFIIFAISKLNSICIKLKIYPTRVLMWPMP
jgi:hypothetical protein